MATLRRPVPRLAGLGFFLLVAGAGPFFQGLFFWADLLPAVALLSAGFALWSAGRLAQRLDMPLRGDLAVLGLTALALAYALQFLWAVYPRGNLDWFLRVAAAWFIYVMVSTESGPGLRRALTLTFAVSALCVGAVGLLQYSGLTIVIPSLKAILPWSDVSTTVVAGSFEYHNATAVFMVAAFMAATGLAVDEDNRWRVAGLTGATAFLAVVFLFTASRGVFVVLPLGVLVLVLGLDSGKRWLAVALATASVLPCAAVLKAISRAAGSRHYMDALGWAGAAALAGAGGGLLIATPFRVSTRVKSVLVAGFLILLTLEVAILSAGGDILPAQAASRLASIDAEGAESRLDMTRDALEVALSAPWGRGGWGWDRTYRRFQATPYVSSEVHDHFAQTAVEAGLPGLVALLVALAGGVMGAWRARLEGGAGWGLAAAAIVIAAHSAIDFDLSYGSMWILMWGLLAAASGSDDLRPRSGQKHVAILGAAALVAALVVAAGAAWLAIGARLTERSADLAASGDFVEAGDVAAQAVRFDPWDSQALLLVNTRSSVEAAVRADPRLPEARWQLALRLERDGDIEGALVQANAALEADPWRAEYYQKVADLYGRRMAAALSAGDRETSIGLANSILAVESRLSAKQATVTKSRAPARLPGFSLRYGQALFVTGTPDKAIKPLKDAAKDGFLRYEANVWLYAIYERAGDTKSAKALSQFPSVAFRDANPVYQAIKAW